MKRAVIFDLDGTLLNSLEDLAAAANFALRNRNFPERTVEEVRRFIGNGVPLLIKRAVPAGTPAEVEAACLADFRAYYSAHMLDRTVPYPGIPALLEHLKEQGYRLAVVSNKFETAVQALCRHAFGTLFHEAIGDREGYRKKPAPDNLLRCMERVGVSREEVLYIGDSPTDIETAGNAGVDFIGVLWGFRDEAEMRGHTKAPLARTAEELESLIQAADQNKKS